MTTTTATVTTTTATATTKQWPDSSVAIAPAAVVVDAVPLPSVFYAHHIHTVRSVHARLHQNLVAAAAPVLSEYADASAQNDMPAMTSALLRFLQLPRLCLRKPAAGSHSHAQQLRHSMHGFSDAVRPRANVAARAPSNAPVAVAAAAAAAVPAAGAAAPAAAAPAAVARVPPHIARATYLMRQGHAHKAVQALDSTPPKPPTSTVIADLTALHPHRTQAMPPLPPTTTTRHTAATTTTTATTPATPTPPATTTATTMTTQQLQLRLLLPLLFLLLLLLLGLFEPEARLCRGLWLRTSRAA